MEIQLRVILLIIGLLILCGVAIDLYRRKSFASRQNSYKDTYSPEIDSNEYLYDEGVETVSAPRIVRPAEYSQAPNLDAYDDFSDEIVETVRVVPQQNATKPEVAIPDNVVVIHIMSRVRGGFNGDELYKAISNAHFYLGNNNLFYRHENDDGTGAELFSLVKAVEPGYFDIELLPKQRVPGVTLILIPGKLQDPVFALDKLVRAAKQIAFVLNGELLDHTRQALTLTTIDSYKQKLV